MENSQSQLARERMMADLKTLVGDAEALLQAAVGEAGEKTGEARARLAAALEKAKLLSAELQDRTVSAAKQTAKRVDATVRAHPYESIGVALGVGILVGALWRKG